MRQPRTPRAVCCLTIIFLGAWQAAEARAGVVAYQSTAGGFNLRFGPGSTVGGSARSAAELDRIVVAAGTEGATITSLSVPVGQISDVANITLRPCG